MSFGLLAGLIPSLVPMALEVIGVYDPNAVQVFATAVIMKASVKKEFKLMDQPAETGITTTDHRIVMPIELDFSMVVLQKDYSTAYEEIVKLADRGTFLTVQTRVGVHDNMVIGGMPHEERADMVNGIMLSMHLREVILVTPSYAVLTPSDKSAVDRGTQQGKTPSPDNRTFAQKRFDEIKGLIKKK